MIRSFSSKDTDSVMEVWLAATLDAHNFIDEGYWFEKFSKVRDVYLENSETFVFEFGDEVLGFVSVIEKNFIGALFVSPKFQGNKIGSKLLAFVIEKYPRLSLAVYVENTSAVKFYERNHFTIVERCETETGHDEFLMRNY